MTGVDIADRLDWPTTRSQLLSSGITDSDLKTGLRSKRLIRPRRGVYLGEGVLPDDPDARYRMAIAGACALHQQLPVSHESAAAIHGLPLVGRPPTVVHFTRRGPRKGGGTKGNGIWIHSGRLDDDEVTDVDGIPVTTIARTVADVARNSALIRAVAAADGAVNQDPDQAGQIAESLLRCPRRNGHQRGLRAMRLVDGRSESPRESVTRLILNSVPVDMELQINIYDTSGVFVGRADGGCPACGVLWEYDGESKYVRLAPPGQSTAEVVLAEKRRENRFAELGWLTLRIDRHDHRDQQALIARYAQACGRRDGWHGAGKLAGRFDFMPAARIPV